MTTIALHAITAGGHTYAAQYFRAMHHLFIYLRLPGLPGAVLI